MATEVVTMLRDDIDGTPADRTVSFVWAGAAYEIDLSDKNVAELDSILAPYLAAARRAGGRGGAGRGRRPGRAPRRTGKASTGSAGSGIDLAAVRSWASAHGHAVAARGRISAAILDAYRADSNGASSPTRRRAAAAKAAGGTRPRKRAKAAS